MVPGWHSRNKHKRNNYNQCTFFSILNISPASVKRAVKKIVVSVSLLIVMASYFYGSFIIITDSLPHRDKNPLRYLEALE